MMYREVSWELVDFRRWRLGESLSRSTPLAAGGLYEGQKEFQALWNTLWDLRDGVKRIRSDITTDRSNSK